MLDTPTRNCTALRNRRVEQLLSLALALTLALKTLLDAIEAYSVKKVSASAQKPSKSWGLWRQKVVDSWHWHLLDKGEGHKDYPL